MKVRNNSPVKFTFPQLTHRVWSVWRRNLDVFTKTIYVNFFPSIFEPILYLFAFGFGLGGFVQNIEGVTSYVQFLAPALVAIAVMTGSFFECTYSSFVRMYYQKTFDAIIATPVTVEEVIAGEIVWGATRATINASVVLVVVLAAMAALGLPFSPLFVIMVPLAFVGGLMFAGIAMCFTAIAPNIDFFNYPSFLLVTPMTFLSNTFFPLSKVLPEAGQIAVLAILPLTHVVNLTRTLVLGTIDMNYLLVAIPWIAVATVVFFVLSVNLMKRRLIK
jgi:lipooligosaccharide transport system permease protein